MKRKIKKKKTGKAERFLRDHGVTLALAAAIILAAWLAPHFLKGRGDQYVVTQEVDDMPGADREGFNRDCVRAVLDGGAVLPSCASLAAMQAAYKVDALRLLEDGRGRMIMTARRIARGDIATDDDYRQCLKAERCAPVPTLDPGMKRDSPEGQARRAAFQHLSDGGALTEEMCEGLDICRALVKIGAVKQPPPLR